MHEGTTDLTTDLWLFARSEGDVTPGILKVARKYLKVGYSHEGSKVTLK